MNAESDAVMLYRHEGEIHDQTIGWSFTPAANPGGETYNPAEGYYPDKGGKWAGPLVAAPEGEFRFFRFRFTARAPKGGYWGIMFYDGQGQALVSDIYSSVYPDTADVTYEVTYYGREGAVGFCPFFQSPGVIETSQLEISRIDAFEAADWCDRLYATLPPIPASLSSSSLMRLPKTRTALHEGAPWRVVMLGDSIINDTFNSNFQALVKRMVPQSDMRFLCSVRGSTGCWHYQDPQQFKAYVEDLRPDLLMIGGISHKEDLSAIREVIRLTRKSLGCEILLLSGPLGGDWRVHDAAHPEQALGTQEWAAIPFMDRQRGLAEECSVEFLDLGALWNRYLAESQSPREWFHRDPVHGNDRGKQVVGRFLATAFCL